MEYTSHNFLDLVYRVCDNYKDFVEQNRKLTKRLIKQGYYYSKLCRYFNKFCKKHYYEFNKYDRCLKDHVYDEICNPLCGNKNIKTRTPH